ncbi:MAG: ATP-binding protein, partial [Lentisphaerae bacterium]|nr:ATP-binding protein [Lentisphaerota bacterium]
MTDTRLLELLKSGEGLTAEFKRCSGGVESDVFESICAFLNRFGGDVLLGVEDDG